MSQFDFGTIDPYVVDGVQLADMLNNWRNAVHSWHRGGVRPPYVVPGMMWINDSGGATNWVVNVYMSPTVGDVAMFTYNTSTGGVTLNAAAGGTLAAAILLAQAAASPSVRWSATGNPIDQKNWRATVMPNGALRFSQYNDAGAEVAWTELPAGGAGAQPLVKLFSEVVSTAGANVLRVPIPAAQKKIELQFQIGLQAAFPAADQPVVVQMVQGTTVVGGSTYGTTSGVSTGAAMIPGQALNQAYWNLGACNNCIGKADLYINPPAGSIYMTAQYWMFPQSGSRLALFASCDVSLSASIPNAVQLVMGGSQALVANSFLRCFAG
jgi:hypothetical protein